MALWDSWDEDMNLHRWLDVVAQKNMWRYPRPPVASTVEEMLRLAELGDESPNPDEMHPPVDAPVLEPERQVERTGFLEEHFFFPSSYPTGNPAVDTVHVLGWRPRPSTGPPRRASSRRSDTQSDTALVMVHGAGTPDHGRIHWFVPPVGGNAWDTFSMELPHHMRRQRPESIYSGQFFVTGDCPRLVRAMHQSETDLRALVRGLRRMGYERIVLGGLSIGGNVVFEAILREPVEGAFAIAPSMGAYASLWESVFGECIRAAGNAAGFTDELARRALRLVTPRHMGRPVVGGERLLLIYGANDLLCPPGPIAELRDAWGIENERVLETGHATLVLRFWTVRRTIAAWMKAVVGLP